MLTIHCAKTPSHTQDVERYMIRVWKAALVSEAPNPALPHIAAPLCTHRPGLRVRGGLHRVAQRRQPKALRETQDVRGRRNENGERVGASDQSV